MLISDSSSRQDHPYPEQVHSEMGVSKPDMPKNHGSSQFHHILTMKRARMIGFHVLRPRFRTVILDPHGSKTTGNLGDLPATMSQVARSEKKSTAGRCCTSEAQLEHQEADVFCFVIHVSSHPKPRCEPWCWYIDLHRNPKNDPFLQVNISAPCSIWHMEMILTLLVAVCGSFSGKTRFLRKRLVWKIRQKHLPSRDSLYEQFR